MLKGLIGEVRLIPEGEYVTAEFELEADGCWRQPTRRDTRDYGCDFETGRGDNGGSL